MSIVIVCTRSPERFLANKKAGMTWDKKKRTGTFLTNKLVLELRAAKKADGAPPELADRVTSVLVVTGPLKTANQPHGGRMFAWLNQLVDVAEGALICDGEVRYTSAMGMVRGQVEALVEQGEFAKLARRIQRADDAAKDEDDDYAIRHIVEPVVAKLAAADDLRCVPLLILLSATNEALANHVVRIAALPAAQGKRYRKLRERAARIVDERQESRDSYASAPASVDALRAIYLGVQAGDASARRLQKRLRSWEWQSAQPLLIELAKSGWSPSENIAELVAGDLAVVEIADESVLQLLASEAFAQLGSIAAKVQTVASGHLATYAKSAERVTRAQLAEYERYRDEELVVTPRHRSMDIALFRALNDALHGPNRDRPMLPEAIVVLVCDRRFDDAFAEYAKTFGAANAAAAIRDAIDYFAPGASFTPPGG